MIAYVITVPYSIPLLVFFLAIAVFCMAKSVRNQNKKKREYREYLSNAVARLSKASREWKQRMTDPTTYGPYDRLSGPWLSLFKQLSEVSGNTIRYEIVRRFCHVIEERPSCSGGTYDITTDKRDLPPIKLSGVQCILLLFPPCDQRGWVECILAKFMTIEIPESKSYTTKANITS